ncbi:MAG: hypothetical protein HY646_09720 [Acidobacteria bacterium]|nr:hypothetical protein [Acidobacteriota bacterium]
MGDAVQVTVKFYLWDSLVHRIPGSFGEFFGQDKLDFGFTGSAGHPPDRVAWRVWRE